MVGVAIAVTTVTARDDHQFFCLGHVYLQQEAPAYITAGRQVVGGRQAGRLWGAGKQVGCTAQAGRLGGAGRQVGGGRLAGCRGQEGKVVGGRKEGNRGQAGRRVRERVIGSSYVVTQW